MNVQSPGTATIETGTGTLTIYNPDGTPSDDGAVERWRVRADDRPADFSDRRWMGLSR